METISVRFEEDFVEEIEKAMKENRYATKTEFIREAVRDKVKDLEKQQALLRVEKLYGAGRGKHRNITDEDIHRARERVGRELAKELGIDLD